MGFGVVLRRPAPRGCHAGGEHADVCAGAGAGAAADEVGPGPWAYLLSRQAVTRCRLARPHQGRIAAITPLLLWQNPVHPLPACSTLALGLRGPWGAIPALRVRPLASPVELCTRRCAVLGPRSADMTPTVLLRAAARHSDVKAAASATGLGGARQRDSLKLNATWGPYHAGVTLFPKSVQMSPQRNVEHVYDGDGLQRTRYERLSRPSSAKGVWQAAVTQHRLQVVDTRLQDAARHQAAAAIQVCVWQPGPELQAVCSQTMSPAPPPTLSHGCDDDGYTSSRCWAASQSVHYHAGLVVQG